MKPSKVPWWVEREFYDERLHPHEVYDWVENVVYVLERPPRMEIKLDGLTVYRKERRLHPPGRILCAHMLPNYVLSSPPQDEFLWVGFHKDSICKRVSDFAVALRASDATTIVAPMCRLHHERFVKAFGRSILDSQPIRSWEGLDAFMVKVALKENPREYE